MKKYDLRKPYVQEFNPWCVHTSWILALRYHQFEIDFRAS